MPRQTLNLVSANFVFMHIPNAIDNASTDIVSKLRCSETETQNEWPCGELLLEMKAIIFLPSLKFGFLHNCHAMMMKPRLRSPVLT